MSGSMTEAARTIYFHGMPGGPGELAMFGPDCADACAGFHVPDRRTGAPAGDPSAYFSALADDLRARFAGQRLHLIGFSIGAATALRVAARLGSQVERIDLVSAAAPLGAGALPEEMAGAPVFRIARARPWLFGLMARAQALAASVAPGTLYNALFASARGGDIGLRADAVFRAGMLRVLRQCLGKGLAGYRTEVLAYVGDWEANLAAVRQPVRIWHGTQDNWSPPAMADALARALAGAEAPRYLDGLSHYSALRHVLLNR